MIVLFHFLSYYYYTRSVNYCEKYSCNLHDLMYQKYNKILTKCFLNIKHLKSCKKTKTWNFLLFQAGTGRKLQVSKHGYTEKNIQSLSVYLQSNKSS